MDASSSKSLNATADKVLGIHGSTGTDSKSVTSAVRRADPLVEANNSFVISKVDDNRSRLMALSNTVDNCNKTV